MVHDGLHACMCMRAALTNSLRLPYVCVCACVCAFSCMRFLCAQTVTPGDVTSLIAMVGNALLAKTVHGAVSEPAAVDLSLTTQAAALRLVGRGDLADFIPKSWKEALNFLEDHSATAWDPEYYYDMCPCG
jgi:hypothetical protein